MLVDIGINIGIDIDVFHGVCIGSGLSMFQSTTCQARAQSVRLQPRDSLIVRLCSAFVPPKDLGGVLLALLRLLRPTLSTHHQPVATQSTPQLTTFPPNLLMDDACLRYPRPL